MTDVRSRPFGDTADLMRLRDFLVLANASGQPGYWHIGDLWWGAYQNTIFDPYRSIRIWESAEGEVLGFLWREEPDGINIQVHPRLSGAGLIEEQMLAWALEQADQIRQAGDGKLWCKAHERDERRVSFLMRNGFVRDDFHYLVLRQDLHAPIAESHLPEGFSVRHVGGEEEWAERVATHRDVWHPSRVTLEAYRRLRATPDYRPEIDLAVVAPDGTFASYCICWLDPVNRVGEFEPVGTRAAFRKQGLGKALMREGLRRLYDHGARAAMVISLADNAASVGLYTSVGFAVVDKEYLYSREL